MIGVVADDTTGANDIGIMFRKGGCSVKVVTYRDDLRLTADCEVLILDTDSRLDRPEVSYDKVFKATELLRSLGCTQYFNKTCSVFRGNIGAEFDAMMDCLGEKFAVIVLAFPKNGRQTKNGIHTVWGRRLEESEFAKDPVHPMRESNLVNILQKQTKRRVSLVDLSIVRKGARAVREALEERRSHSEYCIVDATEQSDLAIIAEAVRDFPVLCGSSALGEELPKFMQTGTEPDQLSKLRILDDNGVLVISGSLTPQTKAQVKHLIDGGMPVTILDSRNLIEAGRRLVEIRSAAEEAITLLQSGRDVLLMADNRDEIVEETKSKGALKGLDPLSTSKLISSALAEAAEIIVNSTDLKRLVVAGGDTSGTVCRGLGITGDYVLEGIEPGLPSGLAIGREMLIVLKSGSFGQPEFLEKAVKHLKQLTAS